MKYERDNGRVSCSVLDNGSTLQSIKVLDRNDLMVNVIRAYDFL
jgi:hypothetical protein